MPAHKHANILVCLEHMWGVQRPSWAVCLDTAESQFSPPAFLPTAALHEVCGFSLFLQK